MRDVQLHEGSTLQLYEWFHKVHLVEWSIQVKQILKSQHTRQWTIENVLSAEFWENFNMLRSHQTVKTPLHAWYTRYTHLTTLGMYTHLTTLAYTHTSSPLLIHTPHRPCLHTPKPQTLMHWCIFTTQLINSLDDYTQSSMGYIVCLHTSCEHLMRWYIFTAQASMGYTVCLQTLIYSLHNHFFLHHFRV